MKKERFLFSKPLRMLHWPQPLQLCRALRPGYLPTSLSRLTTERQQEDNRRKPVQRSLRQPRKSRMVRIKGKKMEAHARLTHIGDCFSFRSYGHRTCIA